MKRPKADWVASLIAVTLLIFAAGAALDRSRLVRAASSSNLGRTTTTTSLGTNLGRRHLELDVLVGVVTGTHGDGRRPQPGTTDTDATPVPNLARTLTPTQLRTGVAVPATAPALPQLQHQAGAGAEATRSPSFLLQQKQEAQITLLKARLDALASQPRTGVVPLLPSVTPRPGATPDIDTTGVSTGTTGVAPGRGVTDPILAMTSISPADLGAISPAISAHLATSPPEVCVVTLANPNPNPNHNPNPNPNPNQVRRPTHWASAPRRAPS